MAGMDFTDAAELTAFIETLRDNPPPPARLGGDALRTGQRQRAAAQPPGPKLAEVSDERIDDVAVRVYRPPTEHRGTIAYAHGGMWVIGDLESHDRACHRFVQATGATVLAVDYRRAPEHPSDSVGGLGEDLDVPGSPRAVRRPCRWTMLRWSSSSSARCDAAAVTA